MRLGDGRGQREDAGQANMSQLVPAPMMRAVCGMCKGRTSAGWHIFCYWARKRSEPCRTEAKRKPRQMV
jgi:hypothetical protein